MSNEMRDAFEAWQRDNGWDKVGHEPDPFFVWQAATAHLLPVLKEARGALTSAKWITEMLMKDGGAAATELREEEYQQICKSLAAIDAVIGGV